MKWRRNKETGRHEFGPHAWVTSRKAWEAAGAILALLDYGLQWRGAWTDKCNVMHWQWFPTLAKAKEWVQVMALCPKAKGSPETRPKALPRRRGAM